MTYIVLHGQLQDLLERIDGVLTTDWIPFEVAYVVVRCEHDLDRVVRDYKDRERGGGKHSLPHCSQALRIVGGGIPSCSSSELLLIE